jgi:hypothetical protein
MITTELLLRTRAALECALEESDPSRPCDDLAVILDEIARTVRRMIAQHGAEYAPLRVAGSRLSATLLSVKSAGLTGADGWLLDRLDTLHKQALSARAAEEAMDTVMPQPPGGWGNVAFPDFKRGTARRGVEAAR